MTSRGMADDTHASTRYEALHVGSASKARRWLVGIPVGCALVSLAAFLSKQHWRVVGRPAGATMLNELPPDRVISLPGAEPLEDVHYAGHATVNASNGNALFYWFVESSRVRAGEQAADVPLVLWLNGGPGASSLTGFLVEKLGPLSLDPGGRTLHKRVAPPFANS